MIIEDTYSNELKQLRKKMNIQIFIFTIILLTIFILVICCISTIKDNPSNRFFYTGKGFILENSEIEYSDMKCVENNVLLKGFNGNYYIYNNDTGLKEKKTFKDAIVVELNDYKESTGIIVTSDKKTWFLIDEEGYDKQQIYSDLPIDHNVVSVNMSGKFPVALKKLIVE